MGCGCTMKVPKLTEKEKEECCIAGREKAQKLSQ
jgi:hypothetical protein